MPELPGTPKNRVGSYLSRGQWENLVLLVLLGFLGYGLKRFRWSRPPFVIGLVLGPIAEQNLHKAMSLWGPAFMLRGWSMLLIAIIVVTLVFAFIRQRGRTPIHVG